MNNISIKAKLILIICISLVSILMIGSSAVYGLNNSAAVIKELGWNRLPSVASLMSMSRAQLQTRVQNISVLMYENDNNAQKVFVDILQKKQEAYKEIEAGRNIYEPLSRTAEELGPWKTYVDNWPTWKKTNDRLDIILTNLSHNNDPEQQKVLFQQFRAELETLKPALKTTQTAISQLVDINKSVGDHYYKDSSAMINHLKDSIYIGIVVITILMGLLGYLISSAISTSINHTKESIALVENTNDFTKIVKITSQDEIGQTAEVFNSLLKKLSTAFQDVLNKVSAVKDAAETLATASHQVSNSSNNQSETAAAMAAAVEEMTVSIAHVSNNAADALDMSRKSGQISQEGGLVIQQTVNEMNDIANDAMHTSEVITTLNEQSAQIFSIVKVIRDVAEQTNLLALNAAIEAARAGEQGRGFAVVADEVRKLAERTSSSTEEISKMISQIQERTEAAVKSMDTMVNKVTRGKDLATQAGVYIKEIQNSADQVVIAVNDITYALKEQSEASHLIAKQVENVAQMTEENSAAASQTSNSATHLKTLAAQM